MSFFERIKKIFEPAKQEIIKISLFEVGPWIQQKEQESKTQESIIQIQLKEKAKEFLAHIQVQQTALLQMNLGEYKVEPKIEQIVKENLLRYITHLNYLKANLESLTHKREPLTLQSFLQELGASLANFEKNSFKHYEKATIIIGKELGNIKASIKTFAQDINKIIKNHEPLFENQKMKEEIKKYLKQYYDLDGQNKKINQNIEAFNERIRILDKNLKEKEQELGLFILSQEYQNHLKYEENIKRKHDELQKEILDIKQNLNIKFLLKAFHHDPKKSSLIKSYEDPKEALEQDPTFNILSIIQEASLLPNSPQTLTLITKEQLEKIHQLKTLSITRNQKVLAYENTLKNLTYEIAILNEEKKKELRKQDKISWRINQALDQIKSNLTSFNLALNP